MSSALRLLRQDRRLEQGPRRGVQSRPERRFLSGRAPGPQRLPPADASHAGGDRSSRGARRGAGRFTM